MFQLSRLLLIKDVDPAECNSIDVQLIRKEGLIYMEGQRLAGHRGLDGHNSSALKVLIVM